MSELMQDAAATWERAPLLAAAAMTGIKACFILLLTGLTAQMLRRSSAAKRHLLWVAGICAAVILPLATLSVPNWSVPLRYSVAAAPVAELQETVRSVASLGIVQEPVAHTRRSVAGVVPVPGTAATPAPRVDNRATLGKPVWDLGLPAALFAIWMLGAVIALWPWLLGVIGRSELLQKASDLLPGAWERSLHELRAQGFVPKRVRVLAAAECSTPMTWGVIRPVVLVPTHTMWCENERRNALLHEFAHVRRADYLCKLVSRILCSVYWFNPLAWLAARAERLSREQACDDAVLRSGSRASAYAQQLLDVASGAGRYTIAAAALTMARPSNLARRLRAILDAAPDRSPTGRGLSSIAVGAVCVIVPPLAALSPEWIRESSVTPSRVSAPGLSRQQSRPAPLAPIPPAVRAAFDTAIRTLTDSAEMTLTSATSRMASLARGFATLAPATVQLDQQAVDCVPSGKKSSSNIHNDDGRGPEGRRWQVRWTDGTCRIELDARGTFTLSPNADDITAISARGYVDLEEDDGRTERRVRMQRGENGGVERTYWVNGTRATWDADAAAWFSRVLVMLDRRTAFAVDTRLPMLLQRGGIEAVLAEVAQMPSSYAQRVYYTKLFERQSLSTEQLIRVLETAARTFDSGYEKAELLLSVAKQPSFGAPAHLAFAQMARSIESDYEKRRALSALLTRSDLKPDVVRTMLEATEGMSSDYELAELLLAIDRRYAVDETTRPFYIRALSTIESDYEQRRVLTAIMRAGEISPAASGEMISIAGRTMKGYELAEFLAQISAKGTLDQASSTAFFNAAKNVESDYERRRVLQALLQKGELTRAVIEGILGTAATIESDYECAELLVSVARTGKIDDTLRPSYEKAAATISSDYEYGRAMSAVRRSAQRS